VELLLKSNYADLLFTHLLASDIPTLLRVLFTVTHDMTSILWWLK